MPEPILLRVIEAPDLDDPEPGMMWRYPRGDTTDRECWWIVLPNTKPSGSGYASQVVWLTTDRASEPPHEMWDVQGVPPKIRVNPSINAECWVMKDGVLVREGSYWHGWIKDGMIV